MLVSARLGPIRKAVPCARVGPKRSDYIMTLAAAVVIPAANSIRISRPRRSSSRSGEMLSEAEDMASSPSSPIGGCGAATSGRVGGGPPGAAENLRRRGPWPPSQPGRAVFLSRQLIDELGPGDVHVVEVRKVPGARPTESASCSATARRR